MSMGADQFSQDFLPASEQAGQYRITPLTMLMAPTAATNRPSGEACSPTNPHSTITAPAIIRATRSRRPTFLRNNMADSSRMNEIGIALLAVTNNKEGGEAQKD